MCKFGGEKEGKSNTESSLLVTCSATLAFSQEILKQDSKLTYDENQTEANLAGGCSGLGVALR